MCPHCCLILNLWHLKKVIGPLLDPSANHRVLVCRSKRPFGARHARYRRSRSLQVHRGN